MRNHNHNHNYNPRTVRRWRISSVTLCEGQASYYHSCWLTGLGAPTHEELDAKIKRAGKWGMFRRAGRAKWDKICRSPRFGLNSPMDVPWENVSLRG